MQELLRQVIEDVLTSGLWSEEQIEKEIKDFDDEVALTRLLRLNKEFREYGVLGVKSYGVRDF